MPSPLPFSPLSRERLNLVYPFQAMGSRPAPLESGRAESPPSVDFDPDVPGQETLGACVLKLTHEAFENILPLGIENPTYCSLDNTRGVLSSAGMTFLLEQGLKDEVSSVVLEAFVILVNPFTLADSKVAVPPTTSSAAATNWFCADEGNGPQRKPWIGTSRKNVPLGKPLTSDSRGRAGG